MRIRYHCCRLLCMEYKRLMNNFIPTIITEEDAALNAKYAISIARKIGATIFLLPEDIVEVRHRLVSFYSDLSTCGVDNDKSVY